MEPFSDAPLFQIITPTIQTELATTPTTVKVPPLPPKGKGKVSEKADSHGKIIGKSPLLGIILKKKKKKD